MTLSVAVVGAGLSGLACARALVDHGVQVTVFDKGRGVGGRLATRRAPPHSFDLGAQYFTARDERFRRQVGSWLEHGVCASWRGKIGALDGAGGEARAVEPIERFVGTPDMTSPARHLARGLDVRTGQRVDSLVREGESLLLRGTVAQAGVTLGPASGEGLADQELGRFDRVVLCLPPSQAASLLDLVSPKLAEQARAVEMEPCFAVGLAASGEGASGLESIPFDGVFVGREGTPSVSPLSWVARDSSKPGRPAGERWVLHASGAWSRAMFGAPEEEVTAAMIAELSRLFGLAPLQPSVTVTRRWSLARAPTPLDRGGLFDVDARVGLGGDWACGGRVEGAFLSGLALAEQVLAVPG